MLGKLATVDDAGKMEMLNVYEHEKAGPERPGWWAYYDWPNWWGRVNGLGQATWNINLLPEKPVELHYSWYYYWR